MALNPENRMEQILNGENITPENRSEYYVKEAIDNAGSGGGGSLPAPGTAGNVPTSTGTEWVSAAPKASEYVINGTLAVDLATGTVSVSGIDISKADLDAAIAAYDNVRVRLTQTTPFEIVVNGDYTEKGLEGSATLYYFNAPIELNGDYRIAYFYLKYTTGGDLSVHLDFVSFADSVPYIVHITQNGTTFSTTETCAQIAAAFTAGKAIQARYHFEVAEGEPLVADVNAAVESFTNVNNGTSYVLTVSWHDDSETTKRLYLEMEAATTADVFSYSA